MMRQAAPKARQQRDFLIHDFLAPPAVKPRGLRKILLALVIQFMAMGVFSDSSGEPSECFWREILGAPMALAEDKVHEVTFDDVSLDLDKDEPFDAVKITDRVKELEKEVIRIRGWILPASVFQQKGIRSFVLVRDNMECCFGPGAALDDCIIVEMDPGKSTDFTTRPVAVEGVFAVREFKDPTGRHYAIYHLRGRSVK